MIRVEKGQPDPEELAALLAVLHAMAGDHPSPGVVRETAAWRRPERAGFSPAHSWQNTSREGGQQ